MLNKKKARTAFGNTFILITIAGHFIPSFVKNMALRCL